MTARFVWHQHNINHRGLGLKALRGVESVSSFNKTYHFFQRLALDVIELFNVFLKGRPIFDHRGMGLLQTKDSLWVANKVNELSLTARAGCRIGRSVSNK